MTNKEIELVKKTSNILGKDTKKMNLVDIIAELVEHAEKQEKMMQLFLMGK